MKKVSYSIFGSYYRKSIAVEYYRRVKMNKMVMCLVMAAMFLLPVVNCIEYSVNTNVGQFTEHLGGGVDDQINGDTAITREALSTPYGQ